MFYFLFFSILILHSLPHTTIKSTIIVVLLPRTSCHWGCHPHCSCWSLALALPCGSWLHVARLTILCCCTDSSVKDVVKTLRTWLDMWRNPCEWSKQKSSEGIFRSQSGERSWFSVAKICVDSSLTILLDRCRALVELRRSCYTDCISSGWCKSPSSWFWFFESVGLFQWVAAACETCSEHLD